MSLKAMGWRMPHATATPVVPSAWNLEPPVLSTLGDPVWSASNLDKTFTVEADIGFDDFLETASTPLRYAGRRYFELTWDGNALFDQFGFASGPVAVAGGTLDSLPTPFSAVLLVLGYNSTNDTFFWWLRQWRADGGFTNYFFDKLLESGFFWGDTVGFDVNLDTGAVIGVYVNGVRVLPDTLSSAGDLAAWATNNAWTGAQAGAMQFLHRGLRGQFVTTLRALPADLLFPVPSGAVAWDT